MTNDFCHFCANKEFKYRNSHSVQRDLSYTLLASCKYGGHFAC